MVSLEWISPDTSSQSSRAAPVRMNDYDADTAFLGEWGGFQLRLVLLLCITMIPNGYCGLSIIFVAGTPAHRCRVPEHGLNLTAAWRNVSIPLQEDQQPAKCSRYRLEALLAFSEEGVLPSEVNLSSVPQEGCLDGWEYDRSVYASTIVSDWDLVCEDQWKNPLTSSLFFCGVLVGSFLSGQLSDRFGRKRVLFFTLASQTTLAFIQVFSPSWMVFCILFFLTGMSHISNYLSAFVLGTEILGPRVREFFCTAGSCLFFTVGYMMLPLHAYFLRDWRRLLLGLTAPGFLLLPLWWFIPESPRWLLSQGRIAEAEAIVKNASKMNKKDPPAKIFTSLNVSGSLTYFSEQESKKTKAYNICDILRSRNIRWISIMLWLVWNMLAISYLALSLNTSNLYGDAYLNCFLSAMAEVPAYMISWLMFHCCSRRLSLSASLFAAGLFLLVIQLIPDDLISLAIALEMMGKFAVTLALALVYAYSMELYPTVVRNTALGAGSMASRIGSIIAPYFIYLRSYSASLPYILMGSLTTTAALLSLLLPESYGMPLPETIANMQPFPGCCQKNIYKVTHTRAEANAADRKCHDIQ
nr:organic cation/carnitine transporter 2-like isoform X2 [Doryrhamphus excisus]XP_057942633.1 organic cation/carnitine transporter 2-like isoform X2 [Doryrhamphus excisus]XP_057942634.1 organic cation/carnitine transporter 2-like isoform X2 [Doryrhamphus excisus]